MKSKMMQTSLLQNLFLIGICLFVLLISITLVWPLSASAHEDYIWPYVTIECDNGKNLISIAEGIAESEVDISKIPNAWGLDKMLKYVPAGTEDGAIEIKSPLMKKCKIGKIAYKFWIQPYIYNHRVQGVCGAAASSVQLKISRNNKILINDLVFRKNCFSEDDFDQNIEKIVISELNQNANFQLSQKQLSKQKNISLKALPAIHRKDLFQ